MILLMMMMMVIIVIITMMMMMTTTMIMTTVMTMTTMTTMMMMMMMKIMTKANVITVMMLTQPQSQNSRRACTIKVEQPPPRPLIPNRYPHLHPTDINLYSNIRRDSIIALSANGPRRPHDPPASSVTRPNIAHTCVPVIC